LIGDDFGAKARAQRELWPMLAAGVGALLRRQGAQALAADEIGTLPGLEDLARALQVAQEVSQSAADAVVWDAGSLDGLLRAVRSVSATALLLDRYLTPAMLVQSGGADPSAVEALQAVQAACEWAEQALWPGADVHLAMRPAPIALPQVRAGVSALGLWGCRIRRVIVNGVPEPDAGWPEPWAAQLRADADAARAALADVLGLQVTTMPLLACRADEVPSRISPLLPGMADLGPGEHPKHGAGPGELVGGWIRVEPEGPGYRLVIPLPWVDRDELRVGRSAEHLVLGIGHHRRSIRLPAHLRRCTLHGARLRSGLLTVRMQPDPEAWRGEGPVGTRAAGATGSA